MDGFEEMFAVSYLVPFVLATSLAPAMAHASTAYAAGYRHPARIVDVSSSGHRGGHLDFDDLDGTRDTIHGQRAYNNARPAHWSTASWRAGPIPRGWSSIAPTPGSSEAPPSGGVCLSGYQAAGAPLTPFAAEVTKAADTVVGTATATVSGKFTPSRWFHGSSHVSRFFWASHIVHHSSQHFIF